MLLLRVLDHLFRLSHVLLAYVLHCYVFQALLLLEQLAQFRHCPSTFTFTFTVHLGEKKILYERRRLRDRSSYVKNLLAVRWMELKWSR